MFPINAKNADTIITTGEGTNSQLRNRIHQTAALAHRFYTTESIITASLNGHLGEVEDELGKLEWEALRGNSVKTKSRSSKERVAVVMKQEVEEGQDSIERVREKNALEVKRVGKEMRKAMTETTSEAKVRKKKVYEELQEAIAAAKLDPLTREEEEEVGLMMDVE